MLRRRIMKVVIGCDHGAFQMKEALKEYLSEKEIEVLDVGTHSEDSVDYPEFSRKVCNAVLEGKGEKGIVLCGTGIGVSIAANKVKGIRCALCSESYSAKMTRAHNDANVLAMGARVVGIELAKMIVDTFLATEFEGGRHARRVNMIEPE
jgi:ribose 5-phosphate isomerase B